MIKENANYYKSLNDDISDNYDNNNDEKNGLWNDIVTY